jgi:uncharacterized protein (TIGR03437 family)
MIRFTFFLFGCAAVAGAATISGVYNAGSWLPTSLPNSGVAQGAIFTVTGTGLGPAALQQVQSYPLPTSQGLAGTTMQVKVGTVTQNCIMVYTVASQVAGILPSATPVGSGTLTVSYQGASASIAIQVVAGAFGMFTLNEGGSGPAVVTDLSYNPITMVNPAYPGESLILWGTGLGAVSGDETEPPAAVNFPGVQVLIGTQLVTPSYAGRSSSPGLDQINVTVPAGISGGCKTTLAVVVKGVTGNVGSTSVAPAGQGTCGDTYGALTAANLQKAMSSGFLNIGAVDLSRIASNNDDTLGASFATYPLNSLIRSYAGSYAPSIGNCIAYEVTYGTPLVLTDPIVTGLAHLDAGSALTASKASGGSGSASEISTGVYLAAVGTPANAFIAPGSYTISNGNGGAQVPAFSWAATLPSPVSSSGLPGTINRAQDLTVTWSGGASYSAVAILGYSAVPISTALNSWVEFVCEAAATATQFTIPSAILSLLPTNGYGDVGVQGVGLQIAGVVDNRFTVTGSPGLDAGVLTVFTSNGLVAKVQ